MRKPVNNYPITNPDTYRGTLEESVQMFNPRPSATNPNDAATNRNQRFPSLPNPTVRTETE